MYQEILGHAITKARKEKALSQEKLAGTADLSVRNYRRLEAGEHTPDLLTVFKICHALGLHYSDILEDAFIKYKTSEF